MQRLRELRRLRNLTLRDLERLSGVDHTSICRLENGEYFPKLETLVKLSRALGVGLEDLVDREEMIALAGYKEVRETSSEKV